MIAAVLVLAAVAFLFWKWGPRRPPEPGFEYVYVNQDGSVRELSPGERRYLSEEFHPADGGRPYIKASYESCDGWRSRSGFLTRRRVPARKPILPVHPDYDAAMKAFEQDEDPLAANRAAGDILEMNAEGSTVWVPNPNLSRKARFELVRRDVLARQRQREELGRVPSAAAGQAASPAG
jgi:hypothetical protein